MSRAAAQVRLKPAHPFAPHGGVKIARHAGEGGAFVVALCDANGASDFRAETLHAGYDQALKWARETSRSQAVPVVDETGAAEVAPARAKPVAVEHRATQAAQIAKSQVSAEELTAQLARLRAERGAQDALERLIADAGPACTAAEAEIVVDRALATMRERRAKLSGTDGSVLHTLIAVLKCDVDQNRILMMSLCETLAARILELESRDPAKIYGGALKEGDVAQAGQFYTHGGSLWYCHTTTDGRPATDPDSFTLSVKRGRASEAVR